MKARVFHYLAKIAVMRISLAESNAKCFLLCTSDCMVMMIDISLELKNGIINYPGDAPYEEYAYRTHDHDGVHITRVLMETHSGTHFDAPFHMIADGKKVPDVPLENFIGPCTVVECNSGEIRPQDIPEKHRERILFRTPNSGRYDKFEEDFVYLSQDAADLLVERKVKLVGIDYLSIEKFRSRDHKVHKTILSSGAVIMEGLDLSMAVPGDYELIALPLRMTEDGAPCRAVLREIG